MVEASGEEFLVAAITLGAWRMSREIETLAEWLICCD